MLVSCAARGLRILSVMQRARRTACFVRAVSLLTAAAVIAIAVLKK